MYIVLRRAFKWILPIMGLTIFILFMASLLFQKYDEGAGNWTYICIVCLMEVSSELPLRILLGENCSSTHGLEHAFLTARRMLVYYSTLDARPPTGKGGCFAARPKWKAAVFAGPS